MVPDLNKTSLGMEYFCTEGDDIWKKTDDELIDLAAWELVHLGLARIKEVEGGKVFRQRKAYPIYNSDYRKHLQVIRNFLSTIKNLQTIGRNGLHRYNNQDHSMLTGMLAVENVFGANHDLWELKEQQKYFE
jgi:protoporphyrinogen oxidase